METIMSAVCTRERRGQPEVSFGTPERRWKDDIKMNLKEIGCDDVDWIQNEYVPVADSCGLLN
jgi:hypothetical protein